MSDGTVFQSQWALIKSFLLEKMQLNEVEPASHAKERIQERNIHRSEILDIVRFWSIDEMYEPNTYPYGANACQNRDPVFSITGHDSRGRKLTIAFAFKKFKRELWFEIVTVFAEDEHKNRHQPKLDQGSL